MRLAEHVPPDKPAVVLHPSGTVVTFADLDARANRIAHLLRGHGVGPGDTVAILIDNNPHVHAVMWAARRSGCYYTLINSGLTAAEVAYIVADCNARALFASASVRQVCAELPDHLPGGLPQLTVIAEAELDGWLRYPDCVAGQPVSPVDCGEEGDLLQYSSGSTGRPKGIRRPRGGRRPATGARGTTPVFELVGVTEDSVYLSPAPLYHTAPAMWTMCAQSVGATTVVMQRFDAEQALECIQRYRVTHAQFVPTMFVKMLRLPENTRRAYDLSSLRRVVHASAPCPPDIKREMIDWWGPIIDEYYSSSEGAGITFIRAEEWLTRPGSVGRPILGTPHILDEFGAELPPGEVGDIYFDGGYPFAYLNDEAKTRAARSPQGWVTVGDVGYLDEDGYLYLTDRRHHMIISGGVNIYPQEIENALLSHPLVVDAAVFGVPDEVMGQSVKAVVQLTDPLLAEGERADAMADELLTWLRARLARYKCPRSISFEDELPRTDAGKLNKQPLIAKYSAALR
ncbi:AMP-binding enzyme family protein [Mycolicibacterium hassiacum DSM 44199]|jgi:fatty-acyl-CoA synthase|uniref:AMP-binding enzyme family protein n=1 Tax=Mycolicibacterium hassiacum (strain DSM 44199 / CIP 105218 / JCM 12690 / 3849) TaxID=1122247 RepID=K5B796_MYCHD|nr:fatty-acid--CoA ligase FadD4 [Mycolicibacterium hassiacum]EKF21563.1 AMP-binding enzyme family protein [Mycolicibacterium hassiacum DSM 44199]MDA4084996.1 acyl-CoA synthetase [Mycolicibacterium hassiacum DSM 44199]VCT89089.1 Bile acid-coenzyme A ligase [Mycolicibacterium hassiacum DSM 44199]